MKITIEQMSSFIEQKYKERGLEIAREGNVVIDKVTSDSILAYVFGTVVYKVILKKNEKVGKLTYDCTCPAFSDYGPCKHLAAVVFAKEKLGYQPDDYCLEEVEMFKDFEQGLLTKTKQELIDYIIRHQVPEEY